MMDYNDTVMMAKGYIQDLLEQSRIAIDEEFGTGFAEANPVLVASCVEAGAALIGSARVKNGLMPLPMAIETIASAIQEAAADPKE